MNIIGVEVTLFAHKTAMERDSAGLLHPGRDRLAKHALLSIRDSDGASGHVLVAPEHVRPSVMQTYVEPCLLGQDPFDRNRIWQRLHAQQHDSTGLLTDVTLAAVETALWDLAGRSLYMPAWKILGGGRDRVDACACTLAGGDIAGGGADYAAFAVQLAARGYRAIKLRIGSAAASTVPDVRADLKACAAVREAVGPDLRLEFDGNRCYHREAALFVGRGLQEMGFSSFHEPLIDSSLSSYCWLAGQLHIPIAGPAANHHSCAEWIKHGGCDIAAAGVDRAGGILPALKIAHVAESLGLDCAVYGSGAASLALLGGCSNVHWYERGPLHPLLDDDQCPDFLLSPVDAMDTDGTVPLPPNPGLGLDINFEYITSHRVAWDE